jgi:hypothetical protein
MIVTTDAPSGPAAACRRRRPLTVPCLFSPVNRARASDFDLATAWGLGDAPTHGQLVESSRSHSRRRSGRSAAARPLRGLGPFRAARGAARVRSRASGGGDPFVAAGVDERGDQVVDVRPRARSGRQRENGKVRKGSVSRDSALRCPSVSISTLNRNCLAARCQRVDLCDKAWRGGGGHHHIRAGIYPGRQHERPGIRGARSSRRAYL